jgi:hypothetical protein
VCTYSTGHAGYAGVYTCDLLAVDNTYTRQTSSKRKEKRMCLHYHQLQDLQVSPQSDPGHQEAIRSTRSDYSVALRGWHQQCTARSVPWATSVWPVVQEISQSLQLDCPSSDSNVADAPSPGMSTVEWLMAPHFLGKYFRLSVSDNDGAGDFLDIDVWASVCKYCLVAAYGACVRVLTPAPPDQSDPVLQCYLHENLLQVVQLLLNVYWDLFAVDIKAVPTLANQSSASPFIAIARGLHWILTPATIGKRLSVSLDHPFTDQVLLMRSIATLGLYTNDDAETGLSTGPVQTPQRAQTSPTGSVPSYQGEVTRLLDFRRRSVPDTAFTVHLLQSLAQTTFETESGCEEMKWAWEARIGRPVNIRGSRHLLVAISVHSTSHQMLFTLSGGVSVAWDVRQRPPAGIMQVMPSDPVLCPTSALSRFPSPVGSSGQERSRCEQSQ